ncbi:MAG: MFS transporter [Actinomycetota bacterium]|nr:MFS transporter [Actinomycetota bacterium]
MNLSRTPGAVAGVGLAATLPQLLVALPAGVATDRAERRRMMAGAATLGGAALATLAVLLGAVSVDLAVLDVVAFVVGSAQVLIAASSSALLPQVVSLDGLEGANAWLFSMQHAVASLGGPPLAGVLVALGLGAPMWAAASCYLLAAAVLTSSGVAFRGSDTKQVSSLRADVAEGLKLVAGHRQLRAFTVMTAVANVASEGTVVVLVLYAVAPGPLGLSRVGYGLLLSCFAVGGIVGAGATKRLVRRVGRGKLLAGSVLALAVGLAGPGMLVDPYIAGAALAVAGFGAGCYNVTSVSFRQRVVPAAILGRATAAYRLVALGAVPVGAVLGGVAAKLLGLQGSFLAAGMLTLACLVGMGAVTEGALRSAES